jgi:type II secretory pathway predicted ATPase ExeA
MYETHFGLRQRPFRATPDSGCYYPATGHEQALQRLLRALDEGEGPVLLTGAPGTGKTLLCHCLLERLGPDVTSAFLTQGHFGGRAGLLQSVLYDLSVPHEGRGEQELRLTLTDLLLRNYADGKKAILVVDEAHHLSPDLLEELRLLGNLEARQGKAVQVVLAAQPSLAVTLGRPDLVCLSQRLAVRATVEPMGAAEAADYLVHQVRVAGGRPEDVLAEEARELLARGTRGVPRLLNQAAHEALTLACSAGVRPVDAEAALEALALLGLDVPEDEAKPAADDETLPMPETDAPGWRERIAKPA